MKRFDTFTCLAAGLFAYPRWSQEESAIVYHAGGKLFIFKPEDGSTQQVPTNDAADYRYPHMENAPK